MAATNVLSCHASSRSGGPARAFRRLRAPVSGGVRGTLRQRWRHLPLHRRADDQLEPVFHSTNGQTAAGAGDARVHATPAHSASSPTWRSSRCWLVGEEPLVGVHAERLHGLHAVGRPRGWTPGRPAQSRRRRGPTPHAVWCRDGAQLADAVDGGGLGRPDRGAQGQWNQPRVHLQPERLPIPPQSSRRSPHLLGLKGKLQAYESLEIDSYFGFDSRSTRKKMSRV